jgi:integral membrane protein (TIGR00529 family)
MFELSESTLAFGQIALTFGCIMALIRFKLPLWLSILAGSLALAVLTGLPMRRLALILPETAAEADFVILALMIFGILALSGVQGASGQGRRLVQSMERFIRWPRVRLAIFPAMVGLLPMPGGALFSCPMLDEAAHDMNLEPRRKVLINYWFRHVWELSWPLYPGYVLASSLLGLDLTTLLRYTFPAVIMAVAIGWFFLMRDIKPPSAGVVYDRKEARAALRSFFYESLPLLVTLIGAALFSLLIRRFAPAHPSQTAFLVSVSCGIGLALFQGRGRLEKRLAKIVFNPANFKLLLIVYAIFVFKDVINASGVVYKMGAVGESAVLLLLAIIALPFFCGALTGIMVGYVGACFPIIIGIIAKSGLEQYTVPLIVLALIAGNAGMLISPLHVCLIVTLNYFKSVYFSVWRGLMGPLAAQICFGAVWAALLGLLGAAF